MRGGGDSGGSGGIWERERRLVVEVDVDSLSWLAERRFLWFARAGHEWVFSFEHDASLTVTCLWRLLEGGRIRYTSEDDGQWFGRPAPVDAAAELVNRLRDATLDRVVLREGTLDLKLTFSTGHIVEVLPDSAGYESWVARRGGAQFIAVGGGELVIFGSPPDAA